MFAAWFASGIVMIYVPFPSLSDAMRIKRAEVVNVSGVTITSLSESLVATGISITNSIRLLQYQRRPMLVVEGSSNDVVAGFADSADLIRPLTPTDATLPWQALPDASIWANKLPCLNSKSTNIKDATTDKTPTDCKISSKESFS